MNKQELQTQILSNTGSLFRLASAIDRLPESETRGELIHRHDRILQGLADLHTELDLIDEDACYYGFTHKCLGGVCVECACYYLDESKVPY